MFGTIYIIEAYAKMLEKRLLQHAIFSVVPEILLKVWVNLYEIPIRLPYYRSNVYTILYIVIFL